MSVNVRSDLTNDKEFNSMSADNPVNPTTSSATTVPSDAVVTSTEADGSTKLMRRKESSSYDASKTYVPREDRDEWVLIGLLGQVPMTKGEKTGSGWTKMKDRSGSVELWYIK